MSNYPTGALGDPLAPWEEEDEHIIKCCLCPNGVGESVYKESTDSFSIECEECGAAVINCGSKHEAEYNFSCGIVDNVEHCQYCHRETDGLKIKEDLNGDGYHMTCICGVSSKYGKSAFEAIENWKELK